MREFPIGAQSVNHEEKGASGYKPVAKLGGVRELNKIEEGDFEKDTGGMWAGGSGCQKHPSDHSTSVIWTLP